VDLLFEEDSQTMHHARTISLAVFSVLLVATPAAATAPADRELIREGIELHDAGRYPEAIERFQRALKAAPHDELALYELANTYFYARQLDRCVETGKKALAEHGELGANIHSLLGSCLSDQDKDREAIAVFEAGLRSYPDNALLNFNAAVTYGELHDNDDAVACLRRAIAAEPDYASPYLLLGNTLAKQGRYSVAVFSMLRFLMAEPASPRSPGAAKDLFAHLYAGVEATGGKDLTITLGPGLGDDPLGTLEVSRSIAAAASHVEDDGDDAGSPAARRVGTLLTLAKMTDELGAGDAGFKASPMWGAVVAPVLELQDRDRLETLGYVAAARAGLDGADAWLGSHATRVADLERAIGHPVR
jgi:tetratricopeptide (TPR) repeat protein